MPTKTAKYTLKRSREGQGGKLPEMETEPVCWRDRGTDRGWVPLRDFNRDPWRGRERDRHTHPRDIKKENSRNMETWHQRHQPARKTGESQIWDTYKEIRG